MNRVEIIALCKSMARAVDLDPEDFNPDVPMIDQELDVLDLDEFAMFLEDHFKIGQATLDWCENEDVWLAKTPAELVGAASVIAGRVNNDKRKRRSSPSESDNRKSTRRNKPTGGGN